MEDIITEFRHAIFLNDAFSDNFNQLKIIITHENWWDKIINPWNLLLEWESIGASILSCIHNRGIFTRNKGVSGAILVHKSSKILPGAYIEGPAIIGPGSVIGPNCTLREFVFIDSNVTVGHGAEIKSSLILNGSFLSHFCYLGHSLLGSNCSFSGGAITATSRLDQRTIFVEWGEKRYDSGAFKLGAIIGNNVRLGVNVSIMPGNIIAPNSRVPPNTEIKNNFL